ncbi:hypothetical protein E2562_011525 [Oryza meyeriana var. granulata]|uniref:Uncharacterized protein n=1 Tax=Oryza meyeriana var. granulata TaxID=110450 RepID=A0A6G1D0Z3_9ORYZ|nr:hypothetical protein E2562_011525 [Oryza meyeriana var. granulata]
MAVESVRVRSEGVQEGWRNERFGERKANDGAQPEREKCRWRRWWRRREAPRLGGSQGSAADGDAPAKPRRHQCRDSRCVAKEVDNGVVAQPSFWETTKPVALKEAEPRGERRELGVEFIGVRGSI